MADKIETQTDSARTALIVEDDPDMRAAIAAMIDAEGFVPVAVADGTEAVRLLDTQKFNLILLDIMLPGMSGLEILESIRKNPRHGAVPVIMITAENTDRQLLHGYDLGADYYIPKPFNAKQLRYGIKLCFQPAS